MRDGRFGDALPSQFVHEISTFIKQALSEGHQRVAISLLLAERGLATFVYDIDVSSTGVTNSSSVDYYVPSKSSDRVVPPSFKDYPRLSIDVSVP
jgi:hypothetical protein